MPPANGLRSDQLPFNPRPFLLSTTETILDNQINSDGDDALRGGGGVPVGSVDAQL